jgi:hypothetical protein
MNLLEIQKSLVLKGYQIFTRPFELNIIGVRANSVTPNSFDDSINIFYKTKEGKWIFHSFAATTDPGTYWLKNPMQSKGTAMLKQGQYVGGYQIGLHRGKYLALIQSREVTVIRDYNRDATLDFNNGREFKGYFGINIHRASINGTTKTVDRYSAGCQVYSNANDFATMMQLAERHRQLYGNSFTYTLIDDRAIIREIKKN